VKILKIHPKEAMRGLHLNDLYGASRIAYGTHPGGSKIWKRLILNIRN